MYDSLILPYLWIKPDKEEKDVYQVGQLLHPTALPTPYLTIFLRFDNFRRFSYDNFIQYLPFGSVIHQKIKKKFNFFKIIVEILLYSCYNNFCRKTVLYFDRKDVTTHNIAKFNPPLFLNCSFRSRYIMLSHIFPFLLDYYKIPVLLIIQ